jgi:FG-GAP repeat protein
MHKTRWTMFFSAVALFCGSPSRAHAAGPPLQQQGALPTGSAFSDFGYSVALDGDTLLVGALNDGETFDPDAGNVNGAGAAYVFVRSGSTWSLQAKLTALDGALGDEFGYSVALSGNTAMIGADRKASGEGYVYVFTRSGTQWTQQQELTEASGTGDDAFASSIALSGSTALVGAPGASSNIGAAYVFTSAGGSWSQQAQFTGLAPGDFFGFSVALSPAGDTAVVGSFAAANGNGSAYVFTGGGATWTQPQAPLTASDGASGDRFGYAVAAGSGTILVGAYNAGAGHPGAAYVFGQSGSTWSQLQKLTLGDAPTGSDNFGGAVALSGGTAVVGASEHGSTPGAAYVFTNSGSGWGQPPQVLPAPSGARYFGFSVAANGTSVAMGAFGASNDSGAAYVFAPSSGVSAPALGRKGLGVSALILLLGAAGSLASRTRRGGSRS